ncbi:hypothetical protein [Caenimonas sedimenti]|uniref:hypothetical protein n=1 Tax=Caenimonas sedimenti TaxID=2596921 RepID=UPI001645248E|nr:hypothetical protein [Caenimonas sedimenti]
MMAADIDPTLCTAEPVLETLDDGFSPPHHEEPAPPAPGHVAPGGAECVLGSKSPF